MPILQWLTREADLKLSAHAPYRLLEAVDEHSHGDSEEGNMLIQGDNLDALKALLPFYAGKVRCIYIDPPYNTRSAFEHYDDNLEHTKWLSMMYPRLELLRELLAEDGSVWISIDDNECHYLKVIIDEIFGRSNFLTSFIWKKSYGGGAKSKWFVGLHEFVLCYTKDITIFPEMFLPPDRNAADKYYRYKDYKYESRGPYRLQPLATTSMDDRPNLRYPIILKDGTEVWPEKQWQWSKERALKALEDDELIVTRKKGKCTIAYKQYLRDPQGEERKRKPTSIIDGNYTQHGTYESMALFGLEHKFAFPKPEGLINIILEACTKPGDLVLDSFLGSGTTAAVAHKMGRRYIGIEMGEHAITHCVPRLKKVIDGEQGGISETMNWQGGGGFRFFRLGEPVFDDSGRINENIKFPSLAAHIWFCETKTPLVGKADSPLLGVHDGIAYYLLFNGILRDKSPQGGNVLTNAILRHLPPHDGPRVIYGESCRLGSQRLKSENITFKHIPYDIKAR
ncbi:site-specific DNA-methyltransferase [Desulfocurvibacter africanus]|uniref:site-specific DNA-methyltransferase n=1 Tax=Desulfocurvibacter africanus TaxID=873 RepID=UPI002FD9400F